MSETGVAYACRLLVAGLDALAEATGPSATDDELVSALTVYEGVTRRVDCGVVGVVADLDRRGTRTERGYRNAVTAIADLRAGSGPTPAAASSPPNRPSRAPV